MMSQPKYGIVNDDNLDACSDDNQFVESTLQPFNHDTPSTTNKKSKRNIGQKSNICTPERKSKQSYTAPKLKLKQTLSPLKPEFDLTMKNRNKEPNKQTTIFFRSSCEGNKSNSEGNRLNREGNKSNREGNKPICEGNKPSRKENKPICEENKLSCEGNRPICEGNRPGREGNKPICEENKPSREGNKPICEENKSSCEGNRPICEGNKPGCEENKSCLEPGCAHNHLQLLRSEMVSIKDLICNIRDAVVSIVGQIVLRSESAETRLELTTGNGFFIKGHYIICPASLVLIPPTLLGTGQRIPSTERSFVRATTQTEQVSTVTQFPKSTFSIDDRFALDLQLDFPKEDIRQWSKSTQHPRVFNLLKGPQGLSVDQTLFDLPNELIRVSKVLVAVSNVNGSSVSYSYEADILGIDGAANIAVLYINNNQEWNRCNPPIRTCHPILHWGKSRNSCPGDKIIVIGDIASPDTVGLSNILITGASENGVSFGNIADNRYVSYGGSVPGELLLLSNIFSLGRQQGLPVINRGGAVIGMVINVNNNTPNNIALSEFFMRRPVKALIRSFLDNCVLKQSKTLSGQMPKNYQGFIEPVLDTISSYYRFNKSWLGLGGIAMNQNDFNTIINSNLNTILYESELKNPLIVEDNLERGSECKEIVGYRILAVAGPIAGIGFFIPGTPPINSMIPKLPSSPVYGIIAAGDIITHINGCPLGDRKGQIAPALLMWRVRPGDTVTIRYRKQNENFILNHEITVCTHSYEPFLDFPWYTVYSSELTRMLPVLI